MLLSSDVHVGALGLSVYNLPFPKALLSILRSLLAKLEDFFLAVLQ